jgi:hypothetical protein
MSDSLESVETYLSLEGEGERGEEEKEGSE